MLRHQDHLNSQLQHISEQLRISDARVSSSRDNCFRPPSNLNDLLHAIQGKNKRFEEQRLIKEIKHNPAHILTHETQQNLEAIIQTQINKKQSIPYLRKNQLANLPQINFKDPNNLRILKVNQNFKTQAQRLKLFTDSHQEEETEIDQMAFISFSEDFYQKQALETDFKTENEQIQQVNREQISKEQVASQKMNEKIISCIKGNTTREELNEELEKISAQLELKNPERIFATFQRLLDQKISLAEQKNLSIFEHTNGTYINDYNTFRISIKERFDAEIKLRTLRGRKGRPYEQVEQQRIQKLFCSCFILFLGGQKSKTQLIRLLEQNDQPYFAQAIGSFYKSEQPQKDMQKLNMTVYCYSIFYKLFVKILFPSQSLFPEENNIFMGNEKRIYFYLQLKYRQQFNKTQFYEAEKQQIFYQFIEAIEKAYTPDNKFDAEKALTQLIQIGQFDDLYFNIFVQKQHANKPLQNLLLLDTLVFNKTVFMNSIYTQQQWTAEILHQIYKLVTTANNQNADWMCKFIVELLKKCQPIIGNEIITQAITRIMYSNYALINDPKNAELIEKNFNISWQQMQLILLESFYQFNDSKPTIKQLLGVYINVSDQQNELKKCQNIKMSRFINNQPENAHSEDLKVTQTIENMLKERPEENIYKNRFFILGLKLFSKNFFEFSINSQHLFEEQDQKYFNRFEVTLNKAKRFINKVNEMNGSKALNSESGQGVPNQLMVRDKNIAYFISQASQILEMCQFLGFLYKIQQSFVKKQRGQILVKKSRAFEEFIEKKIDLRSFIGRVNENMEWLFPGDIYKGFRALVQQFEALISIINGRFDWNSRKTNSEIEMMRHKKDFLEDLLTECIYLTKEQAKAHNKRSK